MVDRRVNITNPKAQSKTLYLARDATTLIIDYTIIRHAMCASTSHMHNLNRFHHTVMGGYARTLLQKKHVEAFHWKSMVKHVCAIHMETCSVKFRSEHL